MEDVIRGLTNFGDQFDPTKNSFFIHFESVDYFDVRSLNDKPSREGRLNVEYARKGDKVFLHYIEDGTAISGEGELWFTYNNGICVQREDSGIIIIPNFLPQIYYYFCYTSNLYVDIRQGLKWTTVNEIEENQGKTPSEADFWTLPRMIVENRKHYQLRNMPEVVGGSSCAVIEWPGHDRIWVDPSHSYVIRKRVYMAGEEYPLKQVDNDDLFEVRPDSGYRNPKPSR